MLRERAGADAVGMTATAVLTPPRSLADALANPLPAQLSSVTKSYHGIAALRGLSFSIRPGELVALLGANGAGKTTAVRLLLGLITPTSGVARVFGHDPRNAANRGRTGAMLQVARVPETLRVREHLELFSNYYEEPMPRADVIAAAGLEGLENRLFGELSGGQKQRVLFALAICGNPSLLILDEPTVGLDVEARRAMWQQIRRFIRDGRSILLTTHHIEEADALADRVVVVDRGVVIAEGTPTEIKSRAAGKRIRCTTRLSIDAVRALDGVVSAEAHDAHVEIVAGDSDVVLRQLFVRDASVGNVEVTAVALEDAFLALKGAAS
jgi:ABC-2 type transport system ATP-binding protein